MIEIQWGGVPPSADIDLTRARAKVLSPIERLRRATHRLHEEMKYQQQCVTAFKQNIVRLDKQMQLLSKSCRKFSDTLARVDVLALTKKVVN